MDMSLVFIGRDMPCCLIRDVAQSTQDSTTSWHNPGCQSGNEHTPPYYYCMKCDSMYCSECWAQNQKHKSRGHEETIPNDAITVHTALRVMLQEFTLLQEAIGQLHTRGAAHQWEGSSEWFGVSAKNDAGQCLLSEGPAYEDIMLESPVSCSSVTYPGLVSFVGETGSGKSTLISLLIKFSSSPLSNLFRTPAVGAAGSLNSTSSNVHLYADPETFLTDRPMLYVDCEGMDGDEIPAGMRYKQDSNGVDFEYAQSFTHINTQKIQWGEKMEDRNQLTRKYVTKTLFPRILYIFSDVVVYIPFNRIRLEDTLLHLVEWAHNATEQSYNKPVLPCAIIAFMNRDGQVNPKDYDIDAAKHTVFDKLKDFRNIKGLQSYVEYWESNKQTIDSVEALLRCYYASVSVVNFPNGMLPTKMHEQSTKLYSEIHRAFRESQQRRKTAWMQLNAAALPQYVRKAFTHFASNYTAPFDFSDAWVDLHQISFNFQGSIFNLATKVGLLKRWRGMEVWTEVAEFVASCLLLNCCRHKLPLSLEPKPVLPKQLWDQCKRAADQYWKIYWPCRYTEDGWGSCVNGPNGHVHHQLYDKHRNRINKKVANGPHIPCDNMGSQQLQKEFQTQVEKALAGLAPQAGVLDDTTESLKKVSQLHFRKTIEFYRRLGNIDGLISHSTCLACLNEVPEHCLPCGHVICSACATAVGTPIMGGFIKLDSCPLQRHREDHWSSSWIGSMKPEQAGVRILTLDGGGIKGLVELGILKKIQECLGSIPLRELFDLVVGTSTGGIIACGLGPGGLDVQQCADKFLALSNTAFSKSAVSKIPLFGSPLEKLVSLFNHGSYMTQPLEKALEEAFPKNLNLFGGTSNFSAVPVKVAVTTSTRQGRVIVLSNYNRKPPKRSFYDFQRPSPEGEMQLWEAARATSAAPTYFAPFAHKGTKQVYLDGGLWHNNPIKIAEAESKAIWPANKQPHPDIILSIGAGYHKTESIATIGEQRYLEQVVTETRTDGSGSTWRPDSGAYLRFLLDIALSQITNSLSCERIWHEWLEARAPDSRSERRYRRLNVEFGRPVKMDDASGDGIKACQDAVAHRDPQEFQDIADQLIASCFFFSFGAEDIIKFSNGSYRCSGFIECRLLPKSVKLLGQHLEKLCSPGFRPHFLIKESHRHKGEKMPLDANTINDMKAKGIFQLKYTVFISSELAETEIFIVLRARSDRLYISCFPRKLQYDYDVDFTRILGTFDTQLYRVTRAVKGVTRRNHA